MEKKLLELERIFNDSEAINMIKVHFGEEDSEEMILDLKIEIIKLLEK